ncbi:hypothetical protein [Vulgatibacter sp.]|uniref:hypothetical protein n=1 Tax=Vulgatibacter sp. TaxID=1971226 RepID=UPI00356B1E75
MSSLSSERQTILFSAVALAIFLLVTGLYPDIGKTRTPTRQIAAGKKIPVSITLVTADANDLACAGNDEVGGARCAFDEDGKPWADAGEKPVLAPYMTVDNVLFLIPDLWKEPALAKKLAADPPSIDRERLRRFTAKCELEAVEKAKSFYVRWVPTMEWQHNREAWVGRIAGCSID